MYVYNWIIQVYNVHNSVGLLTEERTNLKFSPLQNNELITWFSQGQTRSNAVAYYRSSSAVIQQNINLLEFLWLAQFIQC